MTRPRRPLLPALFFLGLALATVPLGAAETRDPRAVELAHRTMEAMGGQEAFATTSLLRFDFAVERDGEEVARYHHWWDRHTGDYRLEGVDAEGQPFRVLFDVDSREGRAWVGDRRLEGAELAERLDGAYRRFVNDSYWLLMPWKWLDPGVSLAWLGEREIDGETYDVVELTFGSGVGLTSNDRYQAFVARDSGLMERWEFVLQDEEGRPGTGTPTAWAWEEWQETPAGIRLAAVRRRVGDGPAVRITFPVAAAWREVSPDARRSIFEPEGPLAPPAAPSGDAPAASGLAELLVVLDKAGHVAALVDPADLQVVRRVPTGTGPHEAAVSLDGSTLYVADYGATRPGNTLTVIDLPSGEVVRTVDLGSHRRPHGLAVAADGDLWVTTEGSRSLLRLDGETLAIERVYPTGQEVTHMVALAPGAGRAFTTNLGSGTVSVVEVESGDVRHLQTGAGPEGLAVSPDGAELWVAHREGEDVAVYDAATLELLDRLPTGRLPIRVEMTPDGSRVLVSNAGSNELQVIDRAERTELARIALEEAPVGIEISPDGRRAFVANTGSGRVTVIDLQALEVAGSFSPGREPDGMAWARWPAAGEP